MLAIIKGAGDLATGVAVRLKNSGFDIIMTEISEPTTVRRTVAFSTAVYLGQTIVDSVMCNLAKNAEHAVSIINEGSVAVIVDEDADIIKKLKPRIVIDAIIAKKNTGLSINDAPIVIALGPGFTAGEDCHAVIETKRGHYLGRVIYDGSAMPNTGVPGDVGGYTTERILRAPSDGVFIPYISIGRRVTAGGIIAKVNDEPIIAEIDGIVRGMLQKGTRVTKGMKCGDIDPRCEEAHCFSVSDKARSIGGGVLESILHLLGGVNNV